MTRRSVIAQAHSIRGPAGSGPHGRRPVRQAVEVCAECAAVIFRGACPDCTAPANSPQTADPSPNPEP